MLGRLTIDCFQADKYAYLCLCGYLSFNLTCVGSSVTWKFSSNYLSMKIVWRKPSNHLILYVIHGVKQDNQQQSQRQGTASTKSGLALSLHILKSERKEKWTPKNERRRKRILQSKRQQLIYLALYRRVSVFWYACLYAVPHETRDSMSVCVLYPAF